MDDRQTPTRDNGSVLVYGIVQGVTDDHPLFAFAFRGGRGRALRDLEEFDVAASDVDFMWVHLDLRDVAAQAWLRARPWPPDVIETVAAPIQRGRLFIKPDMIYGHLRDFRDETAAATLQAGSLCVVASHRFIVTGRRLAAAFDRGGATPGRRGDCPARESVRADHRILQRALSRYRSDDAKRGCCAELQAVTATSRYVVIAAARRTRCV